MPYRDTHNISHVTQTDHRILRKPLDDTASVRKENPQLQFFDGAQERMQTWEQNRALGIAIFSFLSKKGQQSPPELANYLESALAVHPADGLALSALGALAMQHGRTELAVRYLTRAQDVPQAEEAAVSGLLDIYYQQARWEESLKYVDRCIELDPGHSGYHAVRADVLMNSGRLPEGIVAAEKSIALDPTRIEVRLWLASAYEKDGRINDATAMREIVRRMQTTPGRIQATVPK
jgi:tetratricopeptide (TPR) repeat protein